MALLILILSLVCLFSAEAMANCSNPAGVAGEQVYNTTYKTMQFCDGTDWISMKGGSVADLTNLNASNLTSGTVPNARLSGNYSGLGTVSATTFSGAHTGNGNGLTNLNASNLTSGTVPISRIGIGTKSIATILRGDNNFTPVPDCDGTDRALNFNATTGIWSCVTIQSGGGGPGVCVSQTVSWGGCSGSTSVQNPGTTITVHDNFCCSPPPCDVCYGETGSAQFKCEDNLTWTYLGGGSCNTCSNDNYGGCGDGDEAREDLPWADAATSKMKACFDEMFAAGDLFSHVDADTSLLCGSSRK